MKKIPLLEVCTSNDVSKILDIPPIAVGQLVFDKKLELLKGHLFDKSQVYSLFEREQNYLQSLR